MTQGTLSNTLKINEIFYSLQGETNLAGIPTVFIRLSGCPLRCSWCDTEYAFKGGKVLSIPEILAQIRKYNCNYVTVTGGEPLAQGNCLKLLTSLADKNYKVNLETGGMLDISKVDSRIMIILDIKTPSSNESKKNLWSNLQHVKEQDQVKFIVASKEDYDWAKSKLKLIPTYAEVLLSPAVPKHPPRELAEWILADDLPVRFQLQLHKILWQDARGK